MRRGGEEMEAFRFGDGEDLDKRVCVWWNVGIKAKIQFHQVYSQIKFCI